MIGDNTEATQIWQRLGRIGIRLALIVGLVLAVKLGFDALSAKIALLENDAAARAMTGMLVTVLIGYAILLAMPFVPGVEIGIALLIIQGPEAAPFVYIATLAGLILAFCIGQFAPLDRLIKLCRDLYLHRIGRLLEKVQSTPRDMRIAALHDRLPAWLVKPLCDYRYVTLGIMINLPGNIALGGGGGITMAAGLSRLFQTGYIALTLALATLPVPLAVWLLGTDIVQ